MTVMQRTKEIGILRSMGASASSIMRVFIWNGLIVGIAGTILGTALGTTLAYLFKKYQFIKLSGDVYYLDYLPVELKIPNILLVIVISIALCFISTLYPAYKASRLDPVEAIRYE
jgi:lipoprotein-releasing system permease protein